MGMSNFTCGSIDIAYSSMVVDECLVTAWADPGPVVLQLGNAEGFL